MGLEFGIKDIIDILLVAILFHQLYKLFRGTGVNNIFIGILSLIVVWFFVVYIFQLELLGSILNQLMNVGIVALIVIFQNEIRRFFFMVGSRNKWRFINKVAQIFGNKKEEETDNMSVTQLVIACSHMAKSKTGALIVLVHKSELEEFLHIGERIDANINASLIENIFFKNSPLHDGAMVISNKKIVSVASILPISENQHIPKHLGLRHRAALGITERSDASAIVVSEEKGTISYAVDGKISINISPEELQKTLSAGAI
ncbi:diadenylate cyclase CdaA [Paludibacter jiangxiensis]|uniref:Diadenylate cyclase n=1 Tax=Paludibacter jiangxiensis TaxID=681398 RepID=A0A170Y2M9_9BACT|nr:diadenylate cyclase CdaA [Paludibacter jiangxiensis]GAT61461.1 TIGR00159 family protein [Paludibacter jiangxiensis]